MSNKANAVATRINAGSSGTQFINDIAPTPSVNLSGSVTELILSREGSTNFDAYVNGSKTTHTSTSASTATLQFYFFGRGNNSTFNNSQLQLFTRGSGWDDATAGAARTSALTLRADIIAAL
jgi:hypothetical protein